MGGRSSLSWIATLPSMLPTAYPSPVGKQVTTLVCHRRGELMTFSGCVGFLFKSNVRICRSAVPTTMSG
jgi:hypothetical protein